MSRPSQRSSHTGSSMLLIDYFERTASERPDNPFVHYVDDEPSSDAVLSYAEANLLASACAEELRNAGVCKGNVVALLLPNSAQWLVWYLACQKLGAICSGLNPQLSDSELLQSLRVLDTRHLVCASGDAERGRNARQSIPELRLLLNFPGVGGREPVERDPVLSREDGLSAIFTSGTTGATPKAALQVHGAVVDAIGNYIRHLGIQAQDRIMLVTPLTHSAALNWGVSLAIMSGATLVLAKKFSASRFWAQADRARPTVLWTMNTILFILLTQPPSNAEARASRQLRLIFGAGSAPRWRQLTQRWHCTVLDGYGMTETFGTLTDADCNSLSGAHACIGRPVKGIDMHIVDPQTGTECAPGVTGEIVTRFGQGFAGYINNPAAFADAVRDGWFHTGDMAFRDEQERYFFVDRLKAIIRRGGENISSIEIEECLAQHPEVLEAIAFPVPHDILGETVMVALVARDAERIFTLDEIRAFCGLRLAPFKWPEHVRTITAEEVPRTVSGKVRKPLLARSLSHEQ